MSSGVGGASLLLDLYLDLDLDVDLDLDLEYTTPSGVGGSFRPVAPPLTPMLAVGGRLRRSMV